MNVKVKLVGLPKLARAVGAGEFEAPLEGGTFGDLLRHLERTYGAPVRKDLVNAQGTVDETVQILRNGDEWVGRDALSLPLADGDEITFLLMMAGG